MKEAYPPWIRLFLLPLALISGPSPRGEKGDSVVEFRGSVADHAISKTMWF
jgi:hypothetical protein